MKAAIFTFDLFNISLQYLQSGQAKRANLELLTFGGHFGRSLFRLTVQEFKGNPVRNIELHLFWLVLYHREVSWVHPKLETYKIEKSGLFA